MNSILVITYGGLGDILLTTPLIKSLRAAWPNARIDVYLQDGRETMLQGCPDINEIHVSRGRRGPKSYWSFIRRFWQKYDLALSVRTSDRQILYARFAGKQSCSLVPESGQNSWWKRLILTGSTPCLHSRHCAIDILALAGLLDIPAITECSLPRDPASEKKLASLLPDNTSLDRCACLHMTPRNPYKDWTAHGWQEVARHLESRGMTLLLLGAPTARDEHIIADFSKDNSIPVINLCGKLSLADSAYLLEHCRLYVGLDTAMTHLASTCECPTVALYGKELPHYMPYHRHLQDSPYEKEAPSILRSEHVRVVTGTCDCGPGVFRCAAQASQPGACMQALTQESVLSAIEMTLAESA
jgi:heptosyltransferase-3